MRLFRHSKSSPVKLFKQVEVQPELHERKQKLSSLIPLSSSLNVPRFRQRDTLKVVLFCSQSILETLQLAWKQSRWRSFMKSTPEFQKWWKSSPLIRVLSRDLFFFSSAIAAARTTTNSRNLNIASYTGVSLMASSTGSTKVLHRGGKYCERGRKTS